MPDEIPHPEATVEQLRAAITWLTGWDTGASSCALVRWRFLGRTPTAGEAPSDADDRGRCIRAQRALDCWPPPHVLATWPGEWRWQMAMAASELHTNKDT